MLLTNLSLFMVLLLRYSCIFYNFITQKVKSLGEFVDRVFVTCITDIQIL